MFSSNAPGFSGTIDRHDTPVLPETLAPPQADTSVLQYALQSYETLDASSPLGRKMRAQVEQLTGGNRDQLMELLKQKEEAHKYQF